MEDLTLSSSNYSAKGSQSEALGLKGRFYPNRLHSPPFGRGWGWVSCPFVLLSDMKGGRNMFFCPSVRYEGGILSFCLI